MPADFGQTLDGVRAHLPHRTIDSSSVPTEEQAETMLERAVGWVDARTRGLIVDPGAYAFARPLAATAAELYAACQYEQATHPEKAAQGSTAYGAVLWEQFRAALEDLLTTIGLDEDGGGEPLPIPGVELDAIDYHFPEPLTLRDRVF